MSPRKRGYHSPVRQQQADQTRRRIIEAAQILISERGYEGATMEAIAQQAGVATPTVYAAFGGKKGIVAQLIDSARFGPAYQELIAEARRTTEPVERLGFAARIARRIYDSEREAMDLLRGAGAVAPELGAMDREREEDRYDAQAGMIEFLVDAGALRPGLERGAAHDVLWALTGRENYRLLVLERGWSADRYEQWLAEVLAALLIAPEVVSRSRKRGANRIG